MREKPKLHTNAATTNEIAVSVLHILRSVTLSFYNNFNDQIEFKLPILIRIYKLKCNVVEQSTAHIPVIYHK